MRSMLAAAGLAALLASAARGGEPETMPLLVGEETEELGVLPRCDDLTIVAVKTTDRGVRVRGLRPGTTVCSFDTSRGAGTRRILRFVVRAQPEPAPGAPTGTPPAEGGATRGGS